VVFESYLDQSSRWPKTGRHVLAQFDASSVVVYQAYRHSIADYAIAHQKFGGDFSYSRMSWIKPNFLWMMYRAGWATREGQERILALRLKREFFDALLATAVPSSFDPARFDSREAWQTRIAESDVRLQWDPDHDPAGKPLARRAIQLGIRGATLSRYGQTELLSIEDLTPFVEQQRNNVEQSLNLVIPREDVYLPAPAARANVGIDDWGVTPPWRRAT
jgi:hypothetical protein